MKLGEAVRDDGMHCKYTKHETPPHSSRAWKLMTPPPFDAALVTPAAVLEAYQRLPLGRFTA